MSKTRAELVTKALLDLGVIAEGQSVSSSELNRMDLIVDPAIAELNALDIYYVSDAGQLGPTGGDIEDSAFLSIALYIANAACSAFNLAADQKMKALETEAIAKLRTLSRSPRTLNTSKLDPALRTWRRGYYPFPNNG